MPSGTNDIKIYTGELVVWGPETEDVAEESKIYLFDGGESELALFDNREKSQKVISALQKIANGSEEETVSGLRNDLEQYGGTNDVTFYWGNEKKCIYHIAYRRGINTLYHVIDAVADGKILRFVEGNKTVVLEKDGFEAVLALIEYGQQKSWLLSGWKVGKPDTNGKVGTQSAATQPEPTFSRQELGAGLLNNIPQNPDNASGTDGNGPERTETDIRFSVAPEDENLVVMHNVTAAKLRKAAKLGGLLVPSLAIVDAERSDFDNFGEISLIADKSLIDSKIKSNKVYNADIYSPRMPEVKNFYSQEDYAKVLRILKQYDGTAEERQASGLNTVEEIIYRHRGGMVSSDLLDNLLQDTYAVINWYCQEHGMETPKEWRKQSDLLNSSDFRNWWETVGIF